MKVRFNIINYAGPSPLDELPNDRPNIAIQIYNHDADKAIGFAEAHNILAAHVKSPAFVITNPDCILHEGAIDALIHRYTATNKLTGIVEGRQWPFEHPKEYDPLDLTTPWASGAFCLFNTELYRSIGGMDERFFLYLEDVDISWRMWLQGALVVYEPRAVASHFTGGQFYRDDLLENEKFFSIRNFILLSRKFFGEDGEKRALEMLKEFPDKEVVAASIKDVNENFQSFPPLKDIDLSKIPQIKVTGINQFHEVRS
ncbi:MAG: hypothetical protein PBV01_03340 [Brucella anthropi]